MPLNAPGLAALIEQKLNAQFPVGERDIDASTRSESCKAIAEAVVEHLLAQAQVVGTVQVAFPSGTGTIVQARLQ